jgi:LacI family transcriptional regulator
MNKEQKDGVLRIVLQFDKAGAYARGIVAGVGHYVRSSSLDWRLQIVSPEQALAADLGLDGCIADFDNRASFDALMARGKPVIAVASARASAHHCPAHVPMIMSDNEAFVAIACEHFEGRGMPNLGFYCRPKYAGLPWAEEREVAFRKLTAARRGGVSVFGDNAFCNASVSNVVLLNDLGRWLRAIPKPCGIIAVNDSSAQELLQACAMVGLSVPDEIAVVGIDNDEVAASLSRVEISSVVQDTERIGKLAAQMLHACLKRSGPIQTRILVAPAGLSVKASSMYLQGTNPLVTRARAFIVQFAGHGIKSDQVAHHVNVSRSTIERLFHQECGCSVHDEILRVRLDMAQHLLKSGKLSASEVAIRCGFRTLQYMHVVFKREVGCTPSEYQATR